MEKKKRQFEAATVALLIFLISLSVFWHDTSIESWKITTELEDINRDETILAMRYWCGAHGMHVDNILVINKEGKGKYIDISDEYIEEDSLLSYMDSCMANGEIPYLPQKINLSSKKMKALVNVGDYSLKKLPQESCDTGGLMYYSVCGSGADRKLVCMQVAGDLQYQSRYHEVRRICKKMDALYSCYEY